MDRRSFLTCLTGVLAFGICGCGTTALTRVTSHLPGAKKQPRPILKVLSIWEPSNGQGHDGKPSRGAAGQIMFFDTSGPTPVPVHGTVRIFEYDGWVTGNEHTDPEPLHTFTFDDGGWNAHRRNGTLGETYHVFVPYMNKHPYQAHCAFRVELTPENGPPISSEFNAVFLPGRDAGNSGLVKSRRHTLADEPLPVAFGPVETGSSGGQSRKTTPARSESMRDTLTIPLPQQKK